MSTPRFDRYYRYAALSDLLHQFALEHPQLVRIASIGRSYEGRDIWLLAVTAFATGPDNEKPAFWLDANIHAAELSGSTACLYFLHTLVTGYGVDPDFTRCLDSRAFYICPRVNPDGAEWALADVPTLIRSGTRPYPYNEAAIGGLINKDIDGDGRLLTMRVPDPDGAWKVSEREPRLMVPREPTEVGGNYFRLLPEGTIENYDGLLIPLQPKKERLDLNRNFPGQWREEHEQPGAGEYPTSEPEVRALVQFISTHPNIGGAVAFHSYSGALLRPFSHRPDDKFPAEDLWTYQTIGAKGTACTGYPAVSAYHDFRYHPDEIITGALDDWLYENKGVFAWTVEIWSPQRQAGITDFKLFDWYRTHPFEDDLKMLAWSDRELASQGYVDWYKFEHPQLGPVELGGWNNLYSFWNPPPRLLEKEIALFPAWLLWHCLILPKLELLAAEISPLGNNYYQVRLAVKNTGWLPTYLTKLAQKNKIVRGVIAEISLPAGASLVTGMARVEGAQLEGRAYKASSPTGWSGKVADETTERVKFEWVVHAPNGGELMLLARHDRAGTVRARLQFTPSD